MCSAYVHLCDQESAFIEPSTPPTHLLLPSHPSVRLQMHNTIRGNNYTNRSTRKEIKANLAIPCNAVCLCVSTNQNVDHPPPNCCISVMVRHMCLIVCDTAIGPLVDEIKTAQQVCVACVLRACNRDAHRVESNHSFIVSAFKACSIRVRLIADVLCEMFSISYSCLHPMILCW